MRLSLRISRLAPVLALFFAACVEESTTPVVFDQLLESTTFENRLLAPVILLRDGMVLDTLPARSYATYELNRKGAIRHAWRIVAPRDESGQPAGVQPQQDLGVQYRVRASYTIDYNSLSQGTVFTPRIANYTPWALRITANYGTSQSFSTNYYIPPNSVTSLTHAPYYYWLSNSNVYLTPSFGGGSYRVFREDSTEYGILEIDPSGLYPGSGATLPISIY